MWVVVLSCKKTNILKESHSSCKYFVQATAKLETLTILFIHFASYHRICYFVNRCWNKFPLKNNNLKPTVKLIQTWLLVLDGKNSNSKIIKFLPSFDISIEIIVPTQFNPMDTTIPVKKLQTFISCFVWHILALNLYFPHATAEF